MSAESPETVCLHALRQGRLQVQSCLECASANLS